MNTARVLQNLEETSFHDLNLGFLKQANSAPYLSKLSVPAKKRKNYSTKEAPKKRWRPKKFNEMFAFLTVDQAYSRAAFLSA